jgi:aminomethyltransferase
MSSQEAPISKQTPLHARHTALGARMAPFGGYEMPIQYGGIIAEHRAARTGVAVFDTCHMGEFRLRGPSACADLEGLVSSRVDTIPVGQCRYGFLCNPEGGVIDDEITYRIADDEFLMVVNAGTQDGDFEWIADHLSPTTEIDNESDRTAKVDVQGPASAKMLQPLLAGDLSELKFYRFQHSSYAGKEVLVSRTGYTGEMGFEVYTDPRTGTRLWDDLIERGATPAGLGARDTLRLEMGFPLYGHELSATRNAAESGLLRAIAPDKTFVGSPVVLDGARRTQKLVGLALQGRRAAREGDTVVEDSGGQAGIVTSGSFSPSLGCSIALAYVDIHHSSPGTALCVATARATLRATVTQTPFYHEATGRRPVREFL